MNLALAAPARPHLCPPAVYPTPEARAHYFAVLRDGWMNLPHPASAEFKNERAFRQHLLILAGYCTHSHTVCESPEDAAAVAALVRPSKGHDYVLTTLRGEVLTVFEARSQGAKALPAAEFYALRDRVFAILAEMIGVDPLTLRDRAGRAA